MNSDQRKPELLLEIHSVTYYCIWPLKTDSENVYGLNHLK